MTKCTCKIRLLDEVTAVVVGLHGDHLDILYKKYSIPAPNYFFNPLFKMGRWDGKIHFMQSNGKTYIYLLEELVPRIVQMGYQIEIEDLRGTVAPSPDPIEDDMFSRIMHPDTGEPTILRYYQRDGINALIEHGFGIVRASTGAGKAQPLTAKVLTPKGWKNMGDVTVGSQVTTPAGISATVLGVFPQPNQQIYKVTFHDGSSTRVTGEHLWKVHAPTRLYASRTTEQIKTTNEIAAFIESKLYGNMSVPVCQPIEMVDVGPLPVHPYVLGALLGDGCLRVDHQLITSADDHIVDAMRRHLTGVCEVTHVSNYDYKMTHADWNSQFNSANLLRVGLSQLGLLGSKSSTKFIPPMYKDSSISTRTSVIQGLMDTDGFVSKKGQVEYYTTSHQMALDVQYMCRSLGFVSCLRSRKTSYQYKGELKQGQECFTVSVAGPNIINLFTLPRKRERCAIRSPSKLYSRRIVKIEPDGCELAQCILIDDPEHLYVTDDFIVTHNTILCTGLCKAYGDVGIKTLTIVPSQDLIKQTKKVYIHSGLDTGEYSGTNKDLNHGHVVSTWQALKNNPKIIELFQMVLVDECHGGKGKELQKILTDHASKVPYRFGVTGTMPPEPSDEMAVYVALGPVRYNITAKQLIDEGILAAPYIDVIQLEEDLKEEYADFCAGLPPTTKPPTYTQYKDQYLPDFTSEKAYLHRRSMRIEWIASYIQAKADQKKGNVMCFVDSIPFGRKLADLIPGAIFVNGQDVKSPAKRREIYDLFEHQDNLTVIATVNIAGTGLDIPRIFNIITIDLGKSFVRVIQALGRGLRKAHDKSTVMISDICGDLKYSKKHLKQRTNYYEDAGYPYKKHKIDYVKHLTDLDI